MRLYGGRQIGKEIGRRIRDSRELRDAIVIDVFPTDHYCRVKIQGSDTHVKAWFPENWESTPQYLKPGNAVRITHPGGNKARIEVAGHGFLLPTAVPGGSVTPTPEAAGDTVLTGAYLTATSPASMGVTVAPGTFRIDEITYSLSGMVMDRPDIVMDRYDLVMDAVGDSVAFDAASATYFRFDSVVVGTDGDAHVVKGANFPSTAPLDPPEAPADHVRLGWVLIYPNMTEVTEADINRVFTTPTPSNFTVTPSAASMALTTASVSLNFSMKDQYGQAISAGGSGWYITLAWNHGNGKLTVDGTEYDELTNPVSFSMPYAALSVTYTRYQNDPLDPSYPRSPGEPDDSSPIFEVSEAVSGLTAATYIVLLNSASGEMWGT